MRFYGFEVERVASGAVVSRVHLRDVYSKAAAEKLARDHAARLTSSQAASSIIRLLGWQRGDHTHSVPLGAFRKHPQSGRVTRV